MTPQFKKCGLAVALVCCSFNAAAQSIPSFQGVVSYETRQVTRSGVTRVESWQESMYRQGNTLWTERVVPPLSRSGAALALSTAASSSTVNAKHESGHQHLDIDTSARWLQLDIGGSVTLRYVDKNDKVVVTIPKAEFGAVGFDGQWGTAAFLVPPGVVANMTPAGPGANGAVWRTEKARDWTHRVLWSNTLQVALHVESKRADGSFTRTIRVKPTSALNTTLPWSKLGTFEQKKYDDYMD